MIKIYYPSYLFKLREPEKKKEEIWDELRKQWVRLTPEEWVRQNFIQYLVQVKKYPASYIAVERKMKLGEVNKRFDLLVFDSAARPWMMILRAWRAPVATGAGSKVAVPFIAAKAEGTSPADL